MNSSTSTALFPVILCGGAGTRLWPVSREAMPKPFMRVRGNESLLQATYQRASALPGVGQITVVTNVQYSYKAAEELSGLKNSVATSFLLEPQARNTAPAIALAALSLQATHGDDAVMLVLPADHLIDKNAAFTHAVTQAVALAQQKKLVLFGIQTTHAETGFGYIELRSDNAANAADQTSAASIYQVKRFVEKPSAELAEEYLRAGHYVWNSGMFCFTVGTLLQALQQHAPEVLNAARAVLAASTPQSNVTTDVTTFDNASFAQLPSISIDYAVMEKADNIAVVPCDIGWSDIGSWKAVAEAVNTDSAGNAVQGQALLLDTTRTYVQSSKRLVAALGLDNVVIIDTEDALLVAHKDASQRVKDVVAQLKTSAAAPLTSEHATTERPWGSYTVLQEGTQFKIKRIEVKPGGKLSLQMHHHRSEHWVVVSGTARVTCGEREYFVAPNESTYIPIGEKHRLENPGKLPLVMIEVQCGNYLGEDDIVRFSDQYGREVKA